MVFGRICQINGRIMNGSNLHTRKFFEWLHYHLGHKSMDDWYSVTQEEIYKNKGQGLLCSYYNGSISKALKSIYPKHNWIIERFKHKPVNLWETNDTKRTLFLITQGWKETPVGFWKFKENQIQYFDWLYVQLGHKSMEDWYEVTVDEVHRYGGARLIDGYYNGSPSKALKSIHPGHNWVLEKFKHKPKHLWESYFEQRNLFLHWNGDAALPKGFWKTPANQRQFFDWLYIQLGFKNMGDWYTISKNTILRKGGKSLLGRFNDSPSKALQSVYCEHKWELWKFNTTPSDYWNHIDNQREYSSWLYEKVPLDQ